MSPRSLLLISSAWLALLALTLTLSFLASAHNTLPGDVDVATWIQDLPFLGTPISDLVRTITETEVVLATGFAVVLILWLRGYRRQALMLAVGLVAMAALGAGLKQLVDRPRPDPALVDVRAGFSSSSFPSGHVTAGSFLYGTLLYFALTLPLPRLPRWILTLVSLFFLVTVGPASVYLGVHWPSDVLGSWGWTLLLLILLVAAERSLFRA